jgi:hypothetical protein
MKCIYLIIFLFISTIAWADEIHRRLLKYDAKHSISIACSRGSDDNVKIILKLIAENEEPDTVETESFLTGGCERSIRADIDFDNDGYNDIYIVEGDQPTATQQVFHVDQHRNKIFRAGNLPVMAEKQKDGSYHYIEVTGDSKFKTVYVFSNKKIQTKKITQLVFYGKVCLDQNGYVNTNCVSGKDASQSNPLCYAKEFDASFMAVPLNKCDIDKSEVSTLHE